MNQSKKEINRLKVVFVAWCLTAPFVLFVFISNFGWLKGLAFSAIFSIPIAVLSIVLIVIWTFTWGIMYGMIILGLWEIILEVGKQLKPIFKSIWNWMHY